jgi:hypothetical protein
MTNEKESLYSDEINKKQEVTDRPRPIMAVFKESASTIKERIERSPSEEEQAHKVIRLPEQYILHLGEENVEGRGKLDGTPIELEARSGCAFRPEYILIPAAIAENFEVIDIKINNVSQMSSPNAIPAGRFSENNSHKMIMDICEESAIISIVARNIASYDSMFAAMAIGALIKHKAFDQGIDQKSCDT